MARPAHRSRRSTCAAPACSTSTRASYVEPGSLLIEGDRIVDVAPTRSRTTPTVIDLGDAHAAARPDGHGGQPPPGRARPRQPARPPCRTIPAVRRCGPSPTPRRTLRAGFTTVRNLGLFVQTGGLLLDVALKKAIDLGWIDGPRVVPAGHAITPDRRAPRPDDVPGVRPARPAAHRRGGHRQRRQRGPQGGPLPDQVRRRSSSRCAPRAA